MRFSRNNQIVTSLLIILLLTSTFVFIQISRNKSQKNTYENVSAEKTKQMIDTDNLIVIDVRTESEYENAHLSGALLVPLQEIKDNLHNLGDISKNQKILVMCKSGYRSAIASKILAQRGYKKVYNLENGILGWLEKDYPIIQEKKKKKVQGLESGDNAPDFTIKTVNDTFSLADYSNEIVLLDFMKSGCESCVIEMKELKEINVAHPEIVMISIGIDENKIKNIRNKENANWDFAADSNLHDEYGVSAYPTMFILGENNIIECKFMGITSDNILSDCITSLKNNE